MMSDNGDKYSRARSRRRWSLLVLTASVSILLFIPILLNFVGYQWVGWEDFTPDTSSSLIKLPEQGSTRCGKDQVIELDVVSSSVPIRVEARRGCDFFFQRAENGVVELLFNAGTPSEGEWTEWLDWQAPPPRHHRTVHHVDIRLKEGSSPVYMRISYPKYD